MKNQAKPARVFHFDLYGKREAKYDFLNTESIESIPWKELDCPEPYHFFVPKDFGMKGNYDSYIGLNEMFFIYSNGLQTDRDSLFIDFSIENLARRIERLLSVNFDSTFIDNFRIVDSSSYKILSAIENNNYSKNYLQKVLYRPFDIRWIYYDPKVISRPAQKVLRHFTQENLGLIISRQQSTYDFQHILLTNIITERCSISLQTKETGYVFPLYLINEQTGQQTLEGLKSRQPNLNLQIVENISEKLGLLFTSEKGVSTGATSGQPASFAPIDLLDYIYAVLHSPTYREKYKEFLKIDFPRVPYPKDAGTFWQLVALGGELRQIHLLESPAVNKYITQYPVGGSNLVEKIQFENGNVYINDSQYFANVPQVAWGFYIGGYQPAQKWLKDRKGRKLEFDDVLHYQKIIVALSETDRIMKEINSIEIE